MTPAIRASAAAAAVEKLRKGCLDAIADPEHMGQIVLSRPGKAPDGFTVQLWNHGPRGQFLSERLVCGKPVVTAKYDAAEVLAALDKRGAR